MNFFEHQDQARRKTGRLIVLFVIAVICILAAVNLAAWGILRIAAPHLAYVEDARPVLRGEREYPGKFTEVDPLWQLPMVYGAVSLATLLIIGGGTAYKTASLSRGGHAVATLLGGRPLDPAGAQGQDRVLQNVVEEMSIASGVPVPTVYVLENEPSINAFAAGFTTDDAVIGVTRGCVDKLNRDELQGVIAHEFSHVLNGDMRLNIRLIGILHGILVIGLLGYALLRSLRFARVSGRRSSKGGGNVVILIMLAGAALLIIGYVGVFFGRLIQSAVSRQREYLADASAVQFTRNPRGIAGALMKIGAFSAGSQVENHHAVETAHLFFAQGIKIGFANLLATHPPLLDRIRRIDPTFTGKIPPLQQLMGSQSAASPAAPAMAAAGAAGFAPQMPSPRSAGKFDRGRVALDADQLVNRVGTLSAASIAHADRLIASIPPAIVEAAHEPFSARAVVFCLLMSHDPPTRQRQLTQLASMVEPGCAHDVRRMLAAIDALGFEARLPLLDLALPALGRMSAEQINRFHHVVRFLVEADKQVSLFEYALHRILNLHLKSPDQRAHRPAVKFYAVNAVKEQAAVVLSALASASETETRQAFDAGARRLDPQRPASFVANANLAAVHAALDQLEHASPPVKQRIIEACAHTVASDGHVTTDEAELLRAIAAALAVPIPPLLAAPGNGDARMVESRAAAG